MLRNTLGLIIRVVLFTAIIIAPPVFSYAESYLNGSELPGEPPVPPIEEPDTVPVEPPVPPIEEPDTVPVEPPVPPIEEPDTVPVEPPVPPIEEPDTVPVEPPVPPIEEPDTVPVEPPVPPIEEPDTVPAEKPIWPASMASRTLPIVYVTTEDSVPVVDKVNKIPAGMYIEVPEDVDGEPLGDESNQISLTIRGRGNASWKLAQKPYKLKLDKKTEVLGMPKSKHFALIPFCDTYAGWLAAHCGMELGRMVGMPWTSRIEACELVLNGSYEGLYFMVESMKIDSNRLDIFEQEDLCEDPELIEGGWLVEIDNYDDPCQIVIQETPKIRLRVTYHTPEELSPIQEDYLIRQFTEMNEAIYSDDAWGSAWAAYIDVASAARYFIVREVMHDTDGYNGSFYLHKDLGEDALWNFGPIWDASLGGFKTDWIMNDHPSYSQVHWIEALFNTGIFRQALIEEWEKFEERLPEIDEYLLAVAERCAAADEANYLRWGKDVASPGAMSKYRYITSRLSANAEWIAANLPVLTGIQSTVRPDAPAMYYNLQGLPLGSVCPAHGIFIRSDANGNTKLIKR